MLSRRVLSKEEETQTPETEVTKEDQEKINTFSRLHNRLKVLDEEVVQMQKDKEDLNDLSNELLLADETLTPRIQYKIGDGFFWVSLSKASKLVEGDIERVESEVGVLEEERDSIKEEVGGLKAHLYARFGRGINLEA